MVPTLIGAMHGCHFTSRCPFAIEACRTAPVPLTGAGQGRQVRCIRAAEIAAGSVAASGSAA
jgi:peptide/nickel transport system ATP-binding protein